MHGSEAPIREKYTLTVEEASPYLRIGENKLRRLAEQAPLRPLAAEERPPRPDQAQAI